MARGSWFAAMAGMFAIGVVAGRSRLIAGLFPEPDVARLITIVEPVGGFTVPGPHGISDQHIENIQAPGLVPGSVAVMFYRTSGKGTFTARVNATSSGPHNSPSNGGPDSWQETIPAGVLMAENNEITFGSSDPQNPVTFSDIAILYKSNKLTVDSTFGVPPIFGS